MLLDVGVCWGLFVAHGGGKLFTDRQTLNSERYLRIFEIEILKLKKIGVGICRNISMLIILKVKRILNNSYGQLLATI